MYSTQINITNDMPALNESSTVGRYLRYPDETGKRVAEGGMRTRGQYKQSLPDLPLISIITVCFNSAKTIEQTIQSVLGQTYGNIEYLIIDAASTDGTLDLIRKYENGIDYFVAEPDRGLYHAMNKGLHLASGNYILILNSDDWYDPECIELLVSGLKASGADFSGALALFVDEEGNLIRALPRMPYDDSSRFGMSLRHELMLIPKGIYNSLGGYDEKFKIIADFDLAVRIYNAGYRYYGINRPLLNFRVSGISNTNWGQLVAEHDLLFSSLFPEVGKESIKLLSDPRLLDADILDKVINEYADMQDFVASLVAYGYRRKFYSALRPPAIASHLSPRISIIVPVHNAALTISRCLNSILGQKVKDIEVLCIDDASKDASLRILRDVAASDARVRVFENAENMGVAYTRNRGIDLARGDYVFFVDADDEVTPSGLERLLDTADRNHSDIVRGAFEKVFHDRTVISGFPPNHTELTNTTPFETSALIESTEGFWSCLYRRVIVRNCRFNEGLVMGEDSLFLLATHLHSLSISWVDAIVYRYVQNEHSAMNTFNFKKYWNAIEWRERAWVMLNGQGLVERANWFAHKYWNPKILADMDSILGVGDVEKVKSRLRTMLRRTRFEPMANGKHDPVNYALAELAGYSAEYKKTETQKTALRVGVFSTFDRGGAAIGSIRRVLALRAAGVDATMHTLINESNYEFVKPLMNKESQRKGWNNVVHNAIDPAKKAPGFCATELFSLPYSVVDYTKYTALFSSLDVIHLHWVVGIFDYENAGEVFGNKPVVWTLADMNAFTGGCHYSEGCDGYTRECKECPLLGTGSTLSHDAWKIKNAAYLRIKNLAIVCPSEWMAEKARRSSLLSGRPIHVIPNAYPVDQLRPVNRMIARMWLGLPLNKRLIMFGADSLASKRKGGDLLVSALHVLKQQSGNADAIEVVTYGHHSIELPLHTHHLGFLTDAEKLSLAYSACDVYVFPSREDNAPLTVGESLLCGTPVVANPTGNVPELVRHLENGYLASYNDAKDFAKGIMWAIDLSHDEAGSIKRSLDCHIRAADFHSPVRAADRHIALYRQMLDN